MKKLFAILTVVGALTFSTASAFAQSEESAASATTEQVVVSETDVEGEPMHQILKAQFLEQRAAIEKLLRFFREVFRWRHAVRE